jgi:hypothetical protein
MLRLGAHPPARGVTSLQRLRREMGCLSKTDEDYKKKKCVLEAVIKEFQSAPDSATGATRGITSPPTPERLLGELTLSLGREHAVDKCYLSSRCLTPERVLRILTWTACWGSI